MNEKHTHYYRDVSKLKIIDVYRMLDLYGVNSHCIGQAIKKLLVAGGRGVKDQKQDYLEAIDLINRQIEMIEEDSQCSAETVSEKPKIRIDMLKNGDKFRMPEEQYDRVFQSYNKKHSRIIFSVDDALDVYSMSLSTFLENAILL